MNAVARSILAACGALILLVSPAAPSVTRDGPIVDLFDITAPVTQTSPAMAPDAVSADAQAAQP